ncbi:MAG TPA: ABC transporter permease [Bacillota bacterium]|nr:ABC transporter permease [Bacillota bacterium]
MHVFKHIMLFTASYFKQLRRKWLTLPLILLFPMILISLIAILFVTFFLPSSHDPIQVGLVNLDQAEEMELVIEFMEDSEQLGDFIHIKTMSENEAVQKIEQNEISSYIIFPDGFTSHLYQGKSVDIPIVGNPEQKARSQIIKELIDSIIRHISVSQANILTINDYLKEMNLDTNKREELLFQYFKDFLFYTFGKDQMIQEEETHNVVTSKPVHYYVLAGWFMIMTIWIWSIYNFLFQDNSIRMKQRMRLYGVSEIQQITAKIIVTLSVTAVLGMSSFTALNPVFKQDFYVEDYIRIAFIICLFSIAYLELLAMSELIISSFKLRLFIQSIVTGLLLLLSGAIIPTIYFPLHWQNYFPYIFSYESFFWLQEIILNERLYANYVPLCLTALAGLFILISCSTWKEYRQ